MCQLFGGFQSSRLSSAGVTPRPNMGAENWNFLKLLKTRWLGLYGFERVSFVCKIPLLARRTAAGRPSAARDDSVSCIQGSPVH